MRPGFPVEPAAAAGYLKAWCIRALRSRITGFRNLVRLLRKHFDAIIASGDLALPNSRLDGINAKIRVIQRRGYGHPNPRLPRLNDLPLPRWNHHHLPTQR